jgi:hypothetical protein
MLRIAYSWARMRTQLETVSAEGVDAGLIRAKVNAARDVLRNLANITRQCTTITTAANEIDRVGQEVRSALLEQLDAIEAAVRAGAGGKQ